MSVTMQGGGGLPPIVRTANRLLVVTEEVVRHFPRYHTTAWMQEVGQCREQLPKYTIGTDMCRQVMQFSRLANRGWRECLRQGRGGSLMCDIAPSPTFSSFIRLGVRRDAASGQAITSSFFSHADWRT